MVTLVPPSFPRASEISPPNKFKPQALQTWSRLIFYASKDNKWLVTIVFYVQSHSCLKVQTPPECDYKYGHEMLICVFDVHTRTTDKSYCVYRTQCRSSNTRDEEMGVIKVCDGRLKSVSFFLTMHEILCLWCVRGLYRLTNQAPTVFGIKSESWQYGGRTILWE